MPDLWPRLDVLVVPSRPTTRWNEPNGTTLLEAMANEVAVIGSDTGVIPELIGDAGIVTPSGEAEALAGALARALDPSERTGLARAARARALKLFSDDAIAERTLRFWQEMLEKPGGTPGSKR
jgi:glycosyltransferase involved in cell wall biosynthesis